jgi:A/G-specific adenine glycosylase
MAPTICKPQNPLCTICVQRNECEAFKHDQVKALPVKEKAIGKKGTLVLLLFVCVE